MSSLQITIQHVVLFIFLFTTVSHSKSITVYVDSESTCINGCGSISKPYSNLKNALEAIEFKMEFSSSDDEYDASAQWYQQSYGFNSLQSNSGELSIPSVIVKPGTYFGEKNKDLIIKFPVNIVSTSGFNKTIIDCQYTGGFLKVIGSTSFFIDGVTITRCNANFGGSIKLTQSTSVLSNIYFKSNIASVGGALYIDSKTTTLIACTFTNNKALEEGGAIYSVSSIVNIMESKFSCNSNSSKYDISCYGSYLTIDQTTNNYQKVGVSCLDECISTIETQPACGQIGSCLSQIPTPTPTMSPNTTATPTPTHPPFYQNEDCLIDGVCDILKENCLSCPYDCGQCKMDGFKLVTYDGCIPPFNSVENCKSKVELIQEINIVNFMPSGGCPVYGEISSYFDVDQDGHYEFKVLADNMGVRLLIDNHTLIDSFFLQDHIDSVRQIRLSKDFPHSFQLMFFSAIPNTRNVSLYWRNIFNDGLFIPVDGYFSQNVCGDKILDPEEKVKGRYYCPIDIKGYSVVDPYCGDGVCSEAIPEECIIDCYKIITPNCPGQSAPSKQGIQFDQDTLGKLISNQYLYTLPGSHLLQHGLDLLTGQPKISPLFKFQYCDNTSFTLVQDFNRDTVYTVPKEIFASISPKCAYQTQTVEYSSHINIANEMAEKSGLAISGSLGGGSTLLSLSVDIAYSKEETVERAKEMESKKEGRLFKTVLSCEFSKLSLIQHTFSNVFLKDIASATTLEEMVSNVNKYGNIYIDNAVMGGTLSQITVVDDGYGRDMESNTLGKQIEISFSNSLNTPVFSATTSYAKTIDSKISNEQQQEFETKSERSTVITKGGPPGAYSTSTESGSFKRWASHVDLLPVPIEYRIGFVADIIPYHWTTTDGMYYLKDKWIEAEMKFLYNVNPDPYKLPIYRNETSLHFIFLDNNSLVTGLVETKVVDEYKQQTKTIINGTYARSSIIKGGIESITINSSIIRNFMVIDMGSKRGYTFKDGLVNPIDMSLPMLSLVFTKSQHINVTNNPISDQFIQVSFVGSSDTDEFIIGSSQIASHLIGDNIVFDYPTTKYIGKLRTISVKLWNGKNQVNSYFSFEKVYVFQSCGSVGSNDKTGCTPFTKYPSKYPYVHAYSSIGQSTVVIPKSSSIEIRLY